MLGAAVVLDSYNFKEELRDKKWNQLDVDAHGFLSQFADVGTQYWSRLNAAKFDVEGALKLGLRGIFTRDYKCYELKDGLKGCAVATASFATLLGHFGKEAVADEIEKLIEERGLSLFSAITIENDNSGQLSKGLVVYQPPKRVTALTEKYDDILALVESTVDMQLSGKTVVDFEKHGSQATYFSVGNNRYSRKAYEAVIKAKF